MSVKGIVVAGIGALMVSNAAVAEMPSFEVGGLVEVEASSSEDYSDNKTSDIVLATVALGVDATVSERVSAHLAFLYEEDETDFGIDEGTVTLGLTDTIDLTGGKMYVPFGRYDSMMVSDPQTLVLGETVESVIMLGMQNEGLYGSVYLFNGDSSESSMAAAGDDDQISSGLNLGYTPAENLDFGISYISNLGDTDTMQALKDTGTAGVVDSHVAGASAHFSGGFGPVMIIAEHVRALESFSNGDLGGKVTAEEQPSATNIEIGVDVGNGVNLAAAYQMTDEALFIGLPEKAVSAAVSYEVMPGASLAAEYASMEDYGTSDGGTGETSNTVTLQLAVEF